MLKLLYDNLNNEYAKALYKKKNAHQAVIYLGNYLQDSARTAVLYNIIVDGTAVILCRVSRKCRPYTERRRRRGY